MKYSIKALTSLVTALFLAASVHAADQCSDVLRGGVFNTVSINQSQGVQNDYNSWLCTTDFRTHQEAHDSGISIGFPVYGVPVAIGGTFNQQATDTWKREHCMQTIDRSQQSALYNKLVSEISDTVVSVWRDCMIGLYTNRIGLSGVALSHGAKQVQMKIRWSPYDTFDSRLPKVKGFSMVGATLAGVGSTLFRVGQNVPATETITDLTRSAANEPVTITLNTDRGSVTAFVPPQAMSIRAQVSITPTIEQREIKTREWSFYQHTPSDDCVRDMNFDEQYFPPDGFTFTSYSYEETTKNGDRTAYSPSRADNGVKFHMHVQGDDGLGGFCKRSGWLGLKIHVSGERWKPTTMSTFVAQSEGKPQQQTLLVHYPYLQPSVDVRQFKMRYTVVVEKIVGDEISTVQLTETARDAGGFKSTADDSGNLVINADEAFTQWRSGLGGGGLLSLNTAALTGRPQASLAASRTEAAVVEEHADAICSAEPGHLVVYSISASASTPGQRPSVTCGTDPTLVHSAAIDPALVTRSQTTE